jgi:tripartite-type tricarboxylate transporter receptor subunit TctC
MYDIFLKKIKEYKFMLNRRHFLKVVPVTLGSYWINSNAQSVRLDNAKMIVGFAPGGTADIVARRLAEKLSGNYASNVVCENKTGAGGQIAVQFVKNAPADGSVTLLTPMSMLGIYPHTYKKLPYDATNDILPVSGAAKFDYGFAVGPQVPDSIKTVPEFLNWSRANPKLANFGSPAAGSSPHFIGNLIGKSSGVELHHIAFRGTQPAILDMIGGQIAAVIGPTGEFTQYTKSGKCRLLATSDSNRNPFTPNIPTLKEQGFRDMQFSEWYGIFLPSGTSKETILRLNQQIHLALSDKEVLNGLAMSYLTPYPTSPSELGQQLKMDSLKWQKIVSDIGFTPED